MEERSRTPSRRSWSQGRPRLDVGEAVPARGRQCHERCGRASGGGTVYVGSRRKASAAAVAELPAAPVLPRVGLGFVGWGVWRRGEPRTASRGPHPLFIALCDGAHQPWIGWAPPTRTRERARYGLWAELTMPRRVSQEWDILMQQWDILSCRDCQSVPGPPGCPVLRGRLGRVCEGGRGWPG
jgi:hypothetical protein